MRKPKASFIADQVIKGFIFFVLFCIMALLFTCGWAMITVVNNIKCDNIPGMILTKDTFLIISLTYGMIGVLLGSSAVWYTGLRDWNRGLNQIENPLELAQAQARINMIIHAKGWGEIMRSKSNEV